MLPAQGPERPSQTCGQLPAPPARSTEHFQPLQPRFTERNLWCWAGDGNQPFQTGFGEQDVSSYKDKVASRGGTCLVTQICWCGLLLGNYCYNIRFLPRRGRTSGGAVRGWEGKL
ncbi:hypothetical protein AV530_020179 [Patagioenas fasciata monilis]|uniref:Uncharacterized protein n=1 Tax=Patagioenas fasciata monilis TaxID=372326 RepID=A0A1V4L0W0_PATFA|nr:hypothetical protein AV530_020179 [Patagioenas fasciata monilis]